MSGAPSLDHAFGGTPSHADFLKRADLTERLPGSKKKDRAFIVPNGLDTLRRGEEINLFWYRRTSSIEMLRLNETIIVYDNKNERYSLGALEEPSLAWKTKLEGRIFMRHCTGVARFVVW
jgi:hypothetical protein